MVQFQPYAEQSAGSSIFGPETENATRALQNWASVGATGIVDDTTWFVWMTQGSAQQPRLEAACGLLRDLA